MHPPVFLKDFAPSAGARLPCGRPAAGAGCAVCKHGISFLPSCQVQELSQGAGDHFQALSRQEEPHSSRHLWVGVVRRSRKLLAWRHEDNRNLILAAICCRSRPDVPETSCRRHSKRSAAVIRLQDPGFCLRDLFEAGEC